MRHVCATIVAAKCTTYSECVCVALCIEHAMRMPHRAICGLTCSTKFSHFLSQTAQFWGKKRLLNIKYIFWIFLQTSSGTFLILRRTKRDIYSKMYIGLHVKCPLFMSDFNVTWIISTGFFGKSSNTKISWKSD